jgi:hypothetical protein
MAMRSGLALAFLLLCHLLQFLVRGVLCSPPCLVYHKIGTYRTELELRLAMIQGVVPSRSTQRIVVRGQRVSEVSRCGPSCSVLQ